MELVLKGWLLDLYGKDGGSKFLWGATCILRGFFLRELYNTHASISDSLSSTGKAVHLKEAKWVLRTSRSITHSLSYYSIMKKRLFTFVVCLIPVYTKFILEESDVKTWNSWGGEQTTEIHSNIVVGKKKPSFNMWEDIFYGTKMARHRMYSRAG